MTALVTVAMNPMPTESTNKDELKCQLTNKDTIGTLLMEGVHIQRVFCTVAGTVDGVL